MSPVLIVIIALLAAGVLALAIFVVKVLVAPKKLDAIDRLIHNGKTQQAVKLAKSIISKNPRDIEAHYILGKAYLADNKPELALMEFKTVNSSGIFSDPNKIPEQEFRQTMAKLYTRFNQPEEALKEYLLLIKLNPNKAEYYFNAAELFEQRNNSDRAASFYQKTVELDPRNAAAHAAFGFLLYKMNKNKIAEEEIATALKLDPNNAKAHYYQGRILVADKEYAKALTEFEKAVRSPELKQKAFIERGRCYMQAGNYERATQEFNTALKSSSSPSSGDTLHARYFLASCLEKTRDIDGAIAQWKEIQKQKKNFMDVNEKLAAYQGVASSDSMKEYLTAGREEFFLICRTITSESIKLVPSSNIKETKYGCVLVAAEGDDGRLNMRKMAHLLVFYRDPAIIDDNFLRGLIDLMKKQSIVKGTVLTSSGFSRAALKFAESRPIDLIGPDKLETILNAINFSKK